MKAKSPLVTLLAGLATGVLLLVLGMNATSAEAPPRGRPAASVSPTAGPTSPVTAPPTRTTAAPDRTRATFAGRTVDGRASIAIAIRDSRVIAYLCDGRRFEAWLRGTAAGGRFTLTGAKNARLTGTYGSGVAAGSGTAAGRRIEFRVRTTRPPSGLYRLATTVGNARIVGGWIVLADGTQVGVITTNQTPAPAPSLDTATGAVTVAGNRLPAAPIDGATGSGF